MRRVPSIWKEYNTLDWVILLFPYTNLNLIRISAVDFHVLFQSLTISSLHCQHTTIINSKSSVVFLFFCLSVSLFHTPLSLILFDLYKIIIMQAYTENAFIAFDVISLFVFNINPYAFCLNRLFVHSFLFEFCLYIHVCVRVTANCVHLCFLLPSLHSVWCLLWIVLYVFGLSVLNSNSSMSHSTQYYGVCMCFFLTNTCVVSMQQRYSWSRIEKPYRQAISMLDFSWIRYFDALTHIRSALHFQVAVFI